MRRCRGISGLPQTIVSNSNPVKRLKRGTGTTLDMPSRMADIMFERFGVPPWSQAKLAKGRAAYLATRTDEEKQVDDLLEYKDL